MRPARALRLLALVAATGCAHAPAPPPAPAPVVATPTAPPPAPAASAVPAVPDVGPLVPFSLLEGKVRGRLPADWQAQDPGERLRGRPDREGLQLFIPYRETDNTADSANALVLAFAVPPDMGIKEFSDRILGASLDPERGGQALKDVTQGSWRLVIARGQQGSTPYALLHRIGVAGGVGVDLMVAVPMLDQGGNHATVDRILAQFAAASDTLQLGDPHP